MKRNESDSRVTSRIRVDDSTRIRLVFEKLERVENESVKNLKIIKIGYARLIRGKIRAKMAPK